MPLCVHTMWPYKVTVNVNLKVGPARKASSPIVKSRTRRTPLTIHFDPTIPLTDSMAQWYGGEPRVK